VKTYLVFAGDDYYPSGGWNDLIGATDEYPNVVPVDDYTFEQDGFRYTDSKLEVFGERYDWVQVVVSATGTSAEIVRPDQRKVPLVPA
jgi:hypothetical protein